VSKVWKGCAFVVMDVDVDVSKLEWTTSKQRFALCVSMRAHLFLLPDPKQSLRVCLVNLYHSIEASRLESNPDICTYMYLSY
jgi:hypothetical protein